MKSKNEVIVNHKLVRVELDPAIGYRVFITMQQGGVVETNPYPSNNLGLVSAMNIATEVMAGKIWLSHLVATAPGWTAPTSHMLNASSNRDELGKKI
jgi:hypothetical protein